MSIENDFTDEEREATKGMPLVVAIGYVAAKREKTANRWKKLSDDLGDLQANIWKRHEDEHSS